MNEFKIGDFVTLGNVDFGLVLSKKEKYLDMYWYEGVTGVLQSKQQLSCDYFDFYHYQPTVKELEGVLSHVNKQLDEVRQALYNCLKNEGMEDEPW